MDESQNILWSPTTNMNVVETWDAINAKREPKNELDKDAFLQLLMAQMSNQDPLNPMDNQDFLAQMAQFTSLEQMVNLNTAYAKTQAYSMLGKQVEGVYTNPVTEESRDVVGSVTAVTTKGSEVYLTVDDGEAKLEVPLSSVTAVGEEYLETALLNSIASDAANTRAQGMVGKRIQAVLYEDGKAVDYVEGIVDYVKFSGMDSVLMVGNKEVLPHEVASVADAGEANPFLLGREINISTPGDGGDYVTQTGTIVDVSIVGGKAVMQVNTGSGTVDVPVKMINYVSEALGYVGREVSRSTFEGTVTGVVFKNTLPYLQVATKNGNGEIETREVSYEDFIKEK